MPIPPAPAVTIDHVDLTYSGRAHSGRTFFDRQENPAVLQDLSLTVQVGEHLAVIGRSGCGKSTLLHLIAGLISPTSGSIHVFQDAESPDRLAHSALMPQGDSLLPWFTVRDNVAVSLRNQGIRRRDARAHAETILERCGLADYATARPDKLSGGMRQRAALGRALLADKPLLLADEPLGALDAITRAGVQEWLITLLGNSGTDNADGPDNTESTAATTMVMVTHDVDEALLLTHRVVLMAAGQITHDWPGWFPRRDGRAREEILADPEFAATRSDILRVLGNTANISGGIAAA